MYLLLIFGLYAINAQVLQNLVCFGADEAYFMFRDDSGIRKGDAQLICEGEGLTLARVSSDDEYGEVIRLRNTIPDVQNFWIGVEHNTDVGFPFLINTNVFFFTDLVNNDLSFIDSGRDNLPWQNSFEPDLTGQKCVEWQVSDNRWKNENCNDEPENFLCRGTCPPTNEPTTQSPTLPTSMPTFNPTSQPTTIPSLNPTSSPTVNPTFNPSNSPTLNPTNAPSLSPTLSLAPTLRPTSTPTPNVTKEEDSSDDGNENDSTGLSLINFIMIVLISVSSLCLIFILYFLIKDRKDLKTMKIQRNQKKSALDSMITEIE